MIKIALVDDQPSMITGLQALLSIHEDLTVVLTASSGEEILEALQKLTVTRFNSISEPSASFPDVVLMDIGMPGMGGVTATKQIKLIFPQLTVLILTTFDDDDFIIDALYYGAAGYLLKDIGGKRLIESIYEALLGNLLLTGRVANKLASNIRQTQPQIRDRLLKLEDLGFSERELEIAQQIVLGFNAKEICAKTFLSIGTVKNYTSSIYAKLGVNERSKAIVALREILKM
jgi:DNA-binding NarL/FixJ family response regulator